MRRTTSVPNQTSLLPLRRSKSHSTDEEDLRRRGGGAAATAWAPRICMAIIAFLAVIRLVVLPQAVRSERVSTRDPAEEKEIQCPRWLDGGSGAIETPKGSWKVPPRGAAGEAARVFLYSVVASTAEAEALLPHFLDFYVRRAGVRADRIHVTIHAGSRDDPKTAAVAAVLDKTNVHYDLWVGTFTSETKAWHRDRLVRKKLEPSDWLVVADVDELHQFPGVLPNDAAGGGAPSPVEAFLAKVEASGANYVLAEWEDRVAEGGHLPHVQPAADAGALEAQFPLRCRMGEWTKPTSGLAAMLPRAEDHKVVAAKVYLRVHRSAHKIQTRSYVAAALRAAAFHNIQQPEGVQGSTWPRAFRPRENGAPEERRVKSQHYKWVAGLVPYLDRRVRVYEKCGLLWSYESAAIVDRLEANRGRVCVTCGELACAHAVPQERRRVAIVTSVWDEHVDGVSITMNRVATYLNEKDSEDVLVLTPHDPQVPTPVMKGLDTIPKFSTGSVPVFALIGRTDYVMGGPLAKAEKAALTYYDPDIYHLVSPDILGFSAQKWARDSGVCSVCTYHTQIDRYVRFYTAKHSMVDKLRPRIAVQKLFSTFYGGCDVIAVPNTAIADKLVLKMAIPREKIGFFPRGVNTTHYSPRKRSVEWRRDRFGANVGDVVVLWAARLVPEKGADLFAEAFSAFFKNETLKRDFKGALDRVRIVVVGSGPSRETMEAALPPDRTKFFGHLTGEELRSAYASSDIYFFPSHTEAFPNTLLEAQASGLAVLAPAYSVNRALVPAGSGHLVDEHAGPAEFADGLFTLIQNPRYRQQIGREAVRVAENRTWAKAFDGLLNCYDRCANLRASGGLLRGR
mmetsp:Transcript_13154/g.40554  ORF Transcript_13154/g.40554 Transcript_13154/m.40554 type:complete len:850 (-) Transcript_13154:22-2571(-)